MDENASQSVDLNIPPPDPAMFTGEWTAEDQAAVDAIGDPTGPRGDDRQQILGSSGVGLHAMMRAKGELGVAEPQAYRKYVHYFGVGGQPLWCAYFLSWCFDTCAVCDNNKQVPWARYGSIGYTGSVYQWARAVGKLVGSPQTGDIYGRVDQQHIGMVVGASPSEIWTINGNWGDRVAYASWHKRGGLWSTGGTAVGLWFARW